MLPPVTEGRSEITERGLRALAQISNWRDQRFRLTDR